MSVDGALPARNEAGTPAHDFGLKEERLAGSEADKIRPPARPALRILLSIGLLAIAFNQRPALSSLAPVLPQITRDLGISAAFAGVLTTAPVFCLGLFGPLGPRLARRFGAETVIVAFLVILAAGLALRGLASPAILLLGSVVAGAAIGVIGVLLPGLIKRDFPAHPGLVTGLYTMALCAGAALGAGVTVPLERLLGRSWPGALAAWAGPALVAALVWLPQARRLGRTVPATMPAVRGLWRDRLAWQVTAFMGLQSSLAYAVFAWLPVALQDRGFEPLMAGLIVSASILAQAVTALIVPMLAARYHDQRLVAVLVVGLAAGGWVGMLFAPLALLWPSALALGFGLGGCFGLALTIIVLRSPDAHVAIHLSGMAQSIGYALASLGPFGLGLAHQWSGGWVWPTLLYLVLAAGALACGIGAGRDRTVLAAPGL